MKKDGFYFGASMGAGGLLKAAWFPLGDFCTDYIDCGEIPAVGQFVSHWPLSAVTHGARPYSTPMEIAKTYPASVTRGQAYRRLNEEFGALGLFDHVGAIHYKTPQIFINELVERGPNRRTSPQIARQVAEISVRIVRGQVISMPFPIVFTAKLPVFTIKTREVVQRILHDLGWRDLSDYTWEPTYFNGLSPSVDEYNGGDHYGVALIEAMHEMLLGNQQTRRLRPLVALGKILDKCYHVEQPFAGSTICNIHKFNGVLTDGDKRSGIVSSYAA